MTDRFDGTSEYFCLARQEENPLNTNEPVLSLPLSWKHSAYSFHGGKIQGADDQISQANKLQDLFCFSLIQRELFVDACFIHH